MMSERRNLCTLFLVVLAAALCCVTLRAQQNGDCNLLVFKEGEKYGYLNTKGKVMIKPRFEDARPFSDGVAIVTVGGRLSIIDTSGKVTNVQAKLAGKNDTIFDFSDGLARFSVGGHRSPIDGMAEDSKVGYINKAGKVVIKPELEAGYSSDVHDFKEGLALVRVGGKFGYVDKTGKYAITPQFDYAYDFSEGLAAINQGLSRTSQGLDGYIDKSGRLVIKPQYNSATNFSEGLAAVRVGNEWGYIDKTGKLVIEPKFDRASEFSEGLAAVEIETWKGNTLISAQWSFISKTGEVVIQLRSVQPSRFSDGLANVRFGYGGSTYVDKAGNFTLTRETDGFVGDFCNGVARSRFPLRYMDRTGKIVWEEK